MGERKGNEPRGRHNILAGQGAHDDKADLLGKGSPIAGGGNRKEHDGVEKTEPKTDWGVGHFAPRRWMFHSFQSATPKATIINPIQPPPPSVSVPRGAWLASTQTPPSDANSRQAVAKTPVKEKTFCSGGLSTCWGSALNARAMDLGENSTGTWGQNNPFSGFE
jgi:hypothetical protein